jgi:membrane associated rhomboid family serine protease
MNFASLPTVTKRLIILNVLVFLFTHVINVAGNLIPTLGLYFFQSEQFFATQLVTHMFTHGGFTHILFNMFALLIFGGPLERVWGPSRFLSFYFITGFGAVFLHQLVDWILIQQALDGLSDSARGFVADNGLPAFLEKYQSFLSAPGDIEHVQTIYNVLNTPVVGASGAVFGVLAGFAMLFPNTELMLLFFPMPIKAKYFVPIYAAIELFLGVTRFGGDNIAHFAHLGGALFGFLLVKYWNSKQDRFY